MAGRLNIDPANRLSYAMCMSYCYRDEDAESDYNIMTGGGLENEWARREAERDALHEGYIARQEEAEYAAAFPVAVQQGAWLCPF